MSAFLNHLAGRALGAPSAGSAQPALPPRFAILRGAENGFAESEAVAAAPRVRSEAPQRPTRPAAQAAALGQPVATPPGRSAAGAADAEAVRAVPPGEAVPPGTGASAATAASAEGPLLMPTGGRQARIAAQATAKATAAAFGPVAQPEPPVEQPPRAAKPALAVPAGPMEVQRPAPWQAAQPLTEAAVAGRAQSRPPAPIVHVTIDRIDLRAPAEPKPAAPERRPRPQPSVSLSEYLAGQGERG